MKLWDRQQWQRYAPHLVLAVVAAFGACGLLFFYWALRPCLLQLPPDTVVHYRLQTTITSMHDEPEVLRQDNDQVYLFGLTGSDQAALLYQPAGLRRGELYTVAWRSSGELLLHDGQHRLDYGPALGYFDFNLLVLPPGLEQDWVSPLTYAYPPPNKRSLSVRIRRTHNGSRPRFRFRIPAIEWVDQAPPQLSADLAERYVQMRDMEVRYRFATGQQVWQDAHLGFTAGVEVPEGVLRHEVAIDLTLQEQAALPTAAVPVTQTVHQLRAINQALAAYRPEEARELLAAASPEQLGHPALAAYWQRLEEDFTARPQPGAHAIQVATTSQSRAAAAQRLRWELVADGYPAMVEQQRGRLVVLAGPFARREARALADVRRRYPANKPHWIRFAREGR